MSLQPPDPTTFIDPEQIVTILLPEIFAAVRWTYLRHQRRICPYELDDLTQQIILTLITDDCRRLRSFKCQSSFKTWLQSVVDHYVYNYFHRQKQTDSLNEIDPGSLIYPPPQDQEIDAAEKRKLLFRAFGLLSEQERLLYQFCFVSELETDKIAAILETEVSSVYKRKQTLVLKLKRLVRNFQGP